jgi:MFS family permease
MAIIGTLLGGRLADHLARKDARAYAMIPAVGALAGLPFSLAALNSIRCRWPSPSCSRRACLGSMWLGPAYGVVQSLVRPKTRATATAVMLFVANLIGLGLGPLFVGILSDVLASQGHSGADAIKWSMMTFALLALPVRLAVLERAQDHARRDRQLGPPALAAEEFRIDAQLGQGAGPLRLVGVVEHQGLVGVAGQPDVLADLALQLAGAPAGVAQGQDRARGGRCGCPSPPAPRGWWSAPAALDVQAVLGVVVVGVQHEAALTLDRPADQHRVVVERGVVLISSRSRRSGIVSPSTGRFTAMPMAWSASCAQTRISERSKRGSPMPAWRSASGRSGSAFHRRKIQPERGDFKGRPESPESDANRGLPSGGLRAYLRPQNPRRRTRPP